MFGGAVQRVADPFPRLKCMLKGDRIMQGP